MVQEWETGCRCAEEFFAIGRTVYICVFVSVFLPFPDVTSNCDLQHQHEPVLVQGSNPVEDASVSDQATLEGMFCRLLGLRVFWGFFGILGLGFFVTNFKRSVFSSRRNPNPRVLQSGTVYF